MELVQSGKTAKVCYGSLCSVLFVLILSLKIKYVGIKELGNGIWKVFYRNVFLGFFNQNRKPIIDRLKNDSSNPGSKDGLDGSLISLTVTKPK